MTENSDKNNDTRSMNSVNFNPDENVPIDPNHVKREDNVPIDPNHVKINETKENTNVKPPVITENNKSNKIKEKNPVFITKLKNQKKEHAAFWTKLNGFQLNVLRILTLIVILIAAYVVIKQCYLSYQYFESKNAFKSDIIILLSGLIPFIFVWVERYENGFYAGAYLIICWIVNIVFSIAYSNFCLLVIPFTTTFIMVSFFLRMINGNYAGDKNMLNYLFRSYVNRIPQTITMILAFILSGTTLVSLFTMICDTVPENDAESILLTIIIILIIAVIIALVVLGIIWAHNDNVISYKIDSKIIYIMVSTILFIISILYFIASGDIYNEKSSADWTGANFVCQYIIIFILMLYCPACIHRENMMIRWRAEKEHEHKIIAPDYNELFQKFQKIKILFMIPITIIIVLTAIVSMNILNKSAFLEDVSYRLIIIHMMVILPAIAYLVYCASMANEQTYAIYIGREGAVSLCTGIGILSLLAAITYVIISFITHDWSFITIPLLVSTPFFILMAYLLDSPNVNKV